MVQSAVGYADPFARLPVLSTVLQMGSTGILELLHRLPQLELGSVHKLMPLGLMRPRAEGQHHGCTEQVSSLCSGGFPDWLDRLTRANMSFTVTIRPVATGFTTKHLGQVITTKH
jgi:hypothetical protein